MGQHVVTIVRGRGCDCGETHVIGHVAGIEIDRIVDTLPDEGGVVQRLPINGRVDDGRAARQGLLVVVVQPDPQLFGRLPKRGHPIGVVGIVVGVLSRCEHRRAVQFVAGPGERRRAVRAEAIGVRLIYETGLMIVAGLEPQCECRGDRQVDDDVA